MATYVATGFSQHLEPEKAARDAAFQSKSNLKHDHIDIALVFSTSHYNPGVVLPVVNRILNNAKIIGCSTAGVILSDNIYHRGIAVLTMSSDEIKFGIGSVEGINTIDPYGAGLSLAKNTLQDFGAVSRNTFLMFMDGNLKNTSLVLKGAQDVFGSVFPIVGGGSSDDFHFKHSYQFYKNKTLQYSAVGLLLGGHTGIGVGGRHGWRPLGKPRIIDGTDDNAITSIDGKKATALYDEYFGKEADTLRLTQLGQMSILYPLGIYVDGSDEYLLKNAVDILQDGSILCQGEVPLGSEVHIMIGNKDSCRQAALEAAQEAEKNLLGKQAKLVIIFESMSRLKLLGRSASQELQYIKTVFGDNVPIIGMYTNGEVCPFQSIERFKKPHWQNESIVVLAIS